MPDTEQRHCESSEGGLHRDGDKPRFADYVPAHLLWEVGQIAAQNCRPREGYPEGKYPDLEGGVSNYKGGIRFTKFLDSIWRHWCKVLMGEDMDEDSGFSHLAHIVCNVAMLYWMWENRKDMDDRNRLPKEATRPRRSLVLRKEDARNVGQGGPGIILASSPCCKKAASFWDNIEPYVHECGYCGEPYYVEVV